MYKFLRWVLLAIVMVSFVLIIGRRSEASTASVNLKIDSTSIIRPISEDIYGVSYPSAEAAAVWRVPLNRLGGNPQSRYNWEDAVWNTGHNWVFANVNDDGSDPNQLPNTSGADQFVIANNAVGIDSIIQMPVMGWVAKDRNQSCGYSFYKYGDQAEINWYAPWFGCGNGRTPGDAGWVTGNDPYDTSKPITEDFGRRWIQHLNGRFGTAANGGVKYYALGNEPMIWHFNHRDIFGAYNADNSVNLDKVQSFDSVTERGIRWGQMVKQADPTAQTMGPGVWGWQPYYYSALDIESFFSSGPDSGTFPDYAAHGNMPFLAWYLQEMRKHEEQNGVRILDYLDIHSYPQLYEGDMLLALGSAGGAEAQAQRLRSTRELWDPNWQSESWIGTEINVIPTMQDWIGLHYPGTKLAITEYSWGANEHINGALAQADVLGIFGREGVDMALLYEPPDRWEPVSFAIQMYRNYDGNGSSFGQSSYKATSTNEMDVSVFAAQNTNGKLTIMVINKTLSEQTANIDIEGELTGNFEVRQYTANNQYEIVRLADEPKSNNFDYTVPRESITLFVVQNMTPTGEPPTNPPVNPPVNPPASADHQVYIPIVTKGSGSRAAVSIESATPQFVIPTEWRSRTNPATICGLTLRTDCK